VISLIYPLDYYLSISQVLEVMVTLVKSASLFRQTLKVYFAMQQIISVKW